MAIFPLLKSEDIVQAGDRIRFSASESFASGAGEGTITKVEIQPSADDDFADVFVEDREEKWYLDWLYTTAGEKQVTLRVTTTIPATETDPEVITAADVMKTITVKTAAAEKLFSSDADLRVLEPDIQKWLPPGYSSWNHVHRQAQRNILDWLDEIRVFNVDGSAITVDSLGNREQVRRLSTMIALSMIFGQLSNQVADVFDAKAVEYNKRATTARNLNYLELDVDGTGPKKPVAQDLRRMRMVRR